MDKDDQLQTQQMDGGNEMEGLDVLDNEETDENDIVIIPGINDLPEFATKEAHKIHTSNLKRE